MVWPHPTCPAEHCRELGRKHIETENALSSEETHQLTFCLVAILLRCRRHRRDPLLHNDEYHKLVKHCVPLRLRCGCSSHPLHPPHWWSTPRNHRVLDLHSGRQLVPLWRHTLFPTLLPPDHDWPNLDRARPAFCPLRPNPLFRSLVFAQWPCLCHRARLACQPIRRRPWPAYQPFPSPQLRLDPEHDPLCRVDLLRRYHSFILHPFETAHALIALLDAPAPLDPKIPQSPLVQPDLLPSFSPFCHLRRSLQFGLLPSHPNLLALRFLRQRIRNWRRAIDPHRPRCDRHQLAADRPVQGLPPLHQGPCSRYRAILPRPDLGAGNPQSRGPVCHPQLARSGLFQPPAGRAGVAGRSDVPRGARGRQHDFLGWGPALGRHLYRD